MEHCSQIIIYQAEDGITKLEVRLENETVWMSQKTMNNPTVKRVYYQGLYNE